RLFAAITAQGARLPSQRRFEARERSERDGVKVPRKLYDDVLKLLD
ncbi:MAG TPA: oxidoreductase, partial [Paraburkholderia sp.]|nr:oxidoreductase [Paraburkholderia sp.]